MNLEEKKTALYIITNQISQQLMLKESFTNLQNYQHNFEKNAIGQVVITTQNGRPFKLVNIKTSVILDLLEWRPVTLFPEDLFAV